MSGLTIVALVQAKRGHEVALVKAQAELVDVARNLPAASATNCTNPSSNPARSSSSNPGRTTRHGSATCVARTWTRSARRQVR